MTLLKIAAGLVLLYVALALLIAAFQDRLLFPRWAMRAGTVALPATAERLSVDVPSGGQLIGAFLPAERPPPDDAALLLGFGGNAWDADLMATYLHSIYPDRDVVTFHYRGYGPSAGDPSARAILEDAVRAHDAVVAAHDRDRIVAVGFSLGAGPAAHLASQRDVALILVTPFDTLTRLVSDLYPWLPVRLLLRHRMDVAGALAGSPAKVAVIAAAQDEIVPPRRTEALRRSTGQLILDRVIPEAGHNDIYDREEFVAAMRKALSLIEANTGEPEQGR